MINPALSWVWKYSTGVRDTSVTPAGTRSSLSLLIRGVDNTKPIKKKNMVDKIIIINL